MHPLVIDEQPVVLRVDFQELGLGLLRCIVVARCESEPVRYAIHVRVDGDALRIAKCLAHDDVGGFAADAGKRLQGVDVVGDGSAEICKHGLRACHDVFRLRAKEPERVDDRFDVFHAGVGHCFRSSEAREKLRGHFVYGGVRALCRKNYRDGEREWVFVIEGAFALAVIFVEAAFYLCRSFSFLGQVFAWHGRILRTVV